MRTRTAEPTRGLSLFRLLVIAICLSLLVENVYSFALVQHLGQRQSCTAKWGNRITSSRSVSLMESSPFTDQSETEKSLHQDNNGKDIDVGAVVRVSAQGMKAFHIMPKGQGSFNDNKEFVPGDKYLELPVGLRGTVTKVYDEEDISANFPIQVKFVPGKNVDEGYDAPVPFVMHFLPSEVECV